MSTTTMKPRVTSFAPQFLVDDLERSIAITRRAASVSMSLGMGSTPSVIAMDWKCI